MEAMQTLNPADVWDMVQKAIVWLAGIGIVIDLTPGIKIQPVRWLIKQLGNLMNHDLKEQLNQLENDFIEHKVDSWRTEILSFQSSCINHERHTKEELQEHPERKTSATKIIIFSILATYYIAFAVGVWVVVTKDFYQLSVLLTFVGGVTAAAVAFYCWKAKAENLLKIKAAYPELSGTLSDFSSMTQ